MKLTTLIPHRRARTALKFLLPALLALAVAYHFPGGAR